MPDGCRMVAIMQPWRPDSTTPLPLGVTPSPGEELMILARAKGSYHQPQPDIWITRRGWCFSHTLAVPVDVDAERAALAEQLEKFLIGELRAGRYHTQNTLQEQGLMKRAPLRRAISDLAAARRVVYADIPEARSRRGGAREYLQPVEFGAPAHLGAPMAHLAHQRARGTKKRRSWPGSRLSARPTARRSTRSWSPAGAISP